MVPFWAPIFDPQPLEYLQCHKSDSIFHWFYLARLRHVQSHCLGSHLLPTASRKFLLSAGATAPLPPTHLKPWVEATPGFDKRAIAKGYKFAQGSTKDSGFIVPDRGSGSHGDARD